MMYVFVRLAIVFILTLLIACGGDSTSSDSQVDPDPSGSGSAPLPPMSKSAARGQALYDSSSQGCLACHGQDGQSTIFAPIDLQATEYEHSSTPGVVYSAEEYLVQFMPVGNESVCDLDCASDIVAYMRYLADVYNSQPDPGPGISYFRLENRQTGQWIQPRSCDGATNETVSLAQTDTSNPDNCTMYSFNQVDTGFFIIQNRHTQGHFRPADCSSLDDESVDIMQVGSNLLGYCVQWALEETDNGYYRIINRSSGHYIRPSGCSATVNEDSISITQVPNNFSGACTQWRLLSEDGNVASLPVDRVPPPGAPPAPTPAPTPAPPPTPESPGPGPSTPPMDIQALMQHPEVNCTTSGCHDSTPGSAKVDLVSGRLEDIALRLVSQPALSSNCSNELLIDPDDIDNSLMLKLIDPVSGSQCTAKMPLGKTGVTSEQYDQFVVWVNDLVTAAPPVVINPPAPVSPPVAATLKPLTIANKAKMILHGGAVTNSELARITDSSGDLQMSQFRILINQWMDTPEFTEMFNDYLELTLQQKFTNTNGRYVNQFANFNDTNAPGFNANEMLRVLKESFLRTAARIVAEGDDYRKVLTTSHWEMTTANMVALASIDGGPFKRVGNFPSLEARDYNDWRTVRITRGSRPINYQENQAFRDSMRAIGDGDSLALYTPRVGFFTSPIYLENWTTNVDNQHRITVNQTVIAALGKSFDVSDTTAPNHTNGLDQNHAQPGTDCRECHQQLDPMSNVFKRYFNVNNMRGKESQSSENPDFAFHGVRDNITTLDDFASALASSPLFAPAQVQKFCSWAKSTPCDETDPAFTTIVNRFRNSGYNFKTLITEFMTSTLFTQEGDSRELVSIARYDRFCTTLKHRLQAVREHRNLPAANMDFCNLSNNNRLFSAIIPRDTFVRGDTEPSLPSQSDFINIKAVESLCTSSLNNIVGGNTNSTFSTSRVSEALDDMASIIMGAPPSTERFQQVRDTFQDVYDISRKSPACGNPSHIDLSDGSPSCGLDLGAIPSMRVVWQMACSSPSLTGIGLE